MIRIGAQTKQIQKLKDKTSRTFNGGLDVADSELNLSSKFARELTNILPGIDGSNEVRQGCRLFADIADESDYDVLNYQYFAARIIVMNKNSEIFAVNSFGAVTRIWDSAIAATFGSTKWPATEHVVFDEFNGSLIVSDGSNKPLTISSALQVRYLSDLATGSNINVPVSRISAKFDKHFVYAVGSVINVSETNAAGTWFGDPGTVYVGSFDLSSYVTSGDTEIIAMMPYKNFLMVMFRECIVPVQLTEVPADGSDPAQLRITVPPDSVIGNYGTVSPRSLQDIGDMALAMDIVGVENVQLTSFTKLLSPDRPSRLIDPLIQRAIGGLTADTLNDSVFSVYDRRLAMYMLFVPNDESAYQTYVRGFGYRYIENMKINAWCTYAGWNWICGTRSSEGRIFFTRKDCTKLFVLGDAVIDPIYCDFVGEQEAFSDGTIFTDRTGLTPVANDNDSGIPIEFAWELPRTDLDNRMLTKTLRYIILDVEGNQQFLCQVFIDNFYEAVDSGEAWSDGTLFSDDTGFVRNEPVRTPALELQFIGRAAVGYGLQSYGSSPYGGGNNTGVELLSLMPTKFKTMKLRFEGETRGPLKFIAITLVYQDGSIRRFGP